MHIAVNHLSAIVHAALRRAVHFYGRKDGDENVNNVLRLTFHIFNEKDRYSRICTEIVVNNTRGLLNNASLFSCNDITCYFLRINVPLSEKLRHDKSKKTDSQ